MLLRQDFGFASAMFRLVPPAWESDPKLDPPFRRLFEAPVQGGEFALAPSLGWMPGPSEPAKPKRGRPTVPDNILLSSRNHWLSLFEEFWP
jgi:hypothetical protein